MKPSHSAVTDMTLGNPVRHILLFALPIFIGNLFQQIYSVVDTMVAGYNLGDPAIAAIGVTASLYSLLIDLTFGLNNGYGVVIAQCFGAHDHKRLRQSLAGVFLLNGVTILLLTSLSLLFLRPILAFMNTPDGIFDDALLYISIICGGMAGTICYNMFAAILRSLGNSRTPLYFLILSSVLNILLDLLFVVGFQMGIAGAAAATVLAQTCSALLCALLFLKNYRSYLPNRQDFRLSPALLADLLSSGIAMGMMYCVVDIGSLIFMRANNLLGETFITAYAAARRIIFLTVQPLGSLANACAVFTGQNWGAGRTDRIRYALRRVLGMELLWSFVAGSILFFFGQWLVRLITGTADPGILSNAMLSIRMNILFLPCLGILLSVRTAMQSMGYKIAPIISSSLEMAMKFASALWLVPKLGFLGTSCTEPATWLICMAFLMVYYWIALRPSIRLF